MPLVCDHKLARDFLKFSLAMALITARDISKFSLAMGHYH